jgi:hypothetical protein
VAARASSATGDEEDFRRSEYQAICDGKVGPQSELYVECAKLADYKPEVTKFFSRIRLVHKLRETRALAGFTRILPPDGNLASDRLQGLKLDQQIDWLPAIKVYGEGIFLEVNPDEITKWAATVPGLRPEFIRLVAHYNAARTARLQPNRNITAKFMLLHTLAHVFINQLSFDCGYCFGWCIVWQPSISVRLLTSTKEFPNPSAGFGRENQIKDSPGCVHPGLHCSRPSIQARLCVVSQVGMVQPHPALDFLNGRFCFCRMFAHFSLPPFFV